MTDAKHVPGYVPNPDYSQEDWDEVMDNPEITDEQWATARPLAEAMPELVEAQRKRRGRPPKEVTKEQIALRVDRDVLEAHRSSGPGWQSRMTALLWLAADVEAFPGADAFDIVPGKDPHVIDAEEKAAEQRRAVRADHVSRALKDLARRVEDGGATQADADRVRDLITSLRGLRMEELDLLSSIISDTRSA